MRRLLVLLALASLLGPTVDSSAEEPMVRVEILSSRPQISIHPDADYVVRTLEGQSLAPLTARTPYEIAAASQGLILYSGSFKPLQLPVSMVLESTGPGATMR